MIDMFRKNGCALGAAGLRRGLCLVLLCALVRTDLPAQQPLSNLRVQTLDAQQPRQVLDSLTIAGRLVGVRDSLSGQALDLRFFTIQNNVLLLDTAGLRQNYPGVTRLLVRYRVLGLQIGKTVLRLDSVAIRKKTGNDAAGYEYTPYESPAQPWETPGLVSNGTYTRGLSFGNSQNLVFNSNLNLQLNGRLGPDLEILAALSDNSVPLQPDGTTRQIQEFDRIFIQIKRNNASLTAGDFDLQRPRVGYFSNYFKRLQGGQIDWTIVSERPKRNGFQVAPPVQDTLSLRFAAAISKGKFARQLISGQEGNQGPYRLQGAEGERFIIVLAGTEKVYIDGIPMRRGLADDYVIDYNLGELSFTQKRLITKDSRIIVEFEYSVQNFLRSNIAANALWQRPKSKVYFNFYSEQDNTSSGAGQDLSETQRERLSLAGDRLSEAFVSGIDTLGAFDATRVMYKLIDTILCGIPRQILVYSTNTDSAIYAARFSEVPPGQGNYVLALSSANGRVYRWIPPDPLTCAPQGNFEPLIRLIAPEMRQLYSLGGETKVFNRGFFQGEAALSNRDYNRLSAQNDRDNLGAGAFLAYRQPLSKPNSPWQSGIFGKYEWVSSLFSPLNPYRPQEFVRDWNLSGATDTVSEQWAQAGIQIMRKNRAEARYEFSRFVREGRYTGLRHVALWKWTWRGFALTGEANYLQSDGQREKSRFGRPKFELSKSFENGQKQQRFKIGLYGERERNRRQASGADTLSRESFWYDLLRFYVQTPETAAPWQLAAFAMQRTDFAPTGSGFTQNTVANEYNINGRWAPENKSGKKTTQNLKWNLSYRTLRISAPELTLLKPQETYLGRLDYSISLLKNGLALTSGYELGSGQSPRIEFSYLAVNPGQGQYTWIDRNQDSILQVDEMELAVFQDQANFVRVSTTSTDYVRTNNVVFNQNVRIEPRLWWSTKTNEPIWKRLLRRLSTQSTWQINRRTYAEARDISPWNPFELNIPDSSFVSVNTSARHVLFVNRASPDWDFSIAQQEQRSQVILTTGFEQRRQQEYVLKSRANLARRWTLEAEASQGTRLSNNQAFATRNFDIFYQSAGPKCSWLPKRNLRWSIGLIWRTSLNRGGEEQAAQRNWNTELSWNPAPPAGSTGFQAATSIRLKGSFADIRYTGAPNTAVAFAMLDGLQNGRNFLWSFVLDRQLSKSLQLNLSYEGRKTGNGRVVHVGRAQVRALF